MIDFQDFFKQMASTPLAPFSAAIEQALKQRFYNRPHGDLQDWLAQLRELPDITPDRVDLTSAAVTLGTEAQLSAEQHAALHKLLQDLHPWRKGPWCLFGVELDTEWRSNLKWDRVAAHIRPLRDKLVLDVGSGNGYYGWRMLSQQPRAVVCIDPSQKFLLQFYLFKKYLPQAPIHYLPLRDEDLPPHTQAFDTVFSMGVLYHRRSPFDHLEQLHQSLKPGGELVLETLVIEGGDNQVFVPADRYAQMPNVWFLPSGETLCRWLERAGFSDARIVDQSRTTFDEQRSTAWMRFQSLPDYLDPTDHSRTIEGYPAPMRAVVLAVKPGT